MDDKTHPVLVLADDATDARCLCKMIRSAPDSFDLRVSRLDSAAVVSSYVAAEKPEAILLETDLDTDTDLAVVASVCHSVGDVPVVLVTPTTDESRHTQALAGGAAGCLTKWKFDNTSLAQTLSDAIRRKLPSPEFRSNAAPR